ncbi:hypothetical protein Q1695_001871 [Nippostrongylus brasiliensis]|nr:hypothetical protein Q1695_001871 [Nippostrongylus brasiliensis]
MSAEYTLNEVASHCTVDDLWIVFDGEVYNMTKYFNLHPGGIAMLRQAGQDASAAMRSNEMHRFAWKTIENKLKEFHIGSLKKL